MNCPQKTSDLQSIRYGRSDVTHFLQRLPLPNVTDARLDTKWLAIYGALARFCFVLAQGANFFLVTTKKVLHQTKLL